MGYLDNRTITVDAILTKRGRQLLSQGVQFFNITKFALSDDEVDYHLWNTAHPSGSNYYGYAIEQMPVLEPSADETQCMRYKLVCLPKDTVKIPVVSVTPTSFEFKQGQEVIITPQTIHAGANAQTVTNLNTQWGYTAILHNSDVAWLQVVDAAPAAPQDINLTEEAMRQLLMAWGRDKDKEMTSAELNALLADLRKRQQELAILYGLQGSGAGIWLGDTETSRSVFAVGLKFRLVAKQISRNNLQTTLTIVGNETGGSCTVAITNKRIKLEVAE